MVSKIYAKFFMQIIFLCAPGLMREKEGKIRIKKMDGTVLLSKWDYKQNYGLYTHFYKS